jgi:hypothetical protein
LSRAVRHVAAHGTEEAGLGRAVRHVAAHGTEEAGLGRRVRHGAAHGTVSRCVRLGWRALGERGGGSLPATGQRFVEELDDRAGAQPAHDVTRLVRRLPDLT